MNCAYCFYSATERERENTCEKVMTDETVGILARKIRLASPRFLSITFQGGEPTLAGVGFFENFISRIKESVDKDTVISFGFQTNGLLIDDSYANFFKENSILVGLSIDGDKTAFDRYRRGRNGESVFDRVKAAAELLNKYGVDFNILSVVTDESAKEITENYSFFKDNGLRFLQFIPFVDELNCNIRLSPENYAAFLKTLFDLWFEDFKNGTRVSVRDFDNYISVILGYPPESCAMSGICGGYFVIEKGGEIYPCDFYCKKEYLLGNIRDAEPFSVTPVRKKFAEESFIIHESCKKCRYYLLCRGGCRFNRTEDLKKNIYCEAYKEFFDYSADRLISAAKSFM